MRNKYYSVVALMIFASLFLVTNEVNANTVACTGENSFFNYYCRTVTAEHTEIIFNGSLIDENTSKAENFTKSSNTIIGGINDIDAINKINELKTEFIDWAKSKGAEDAFISIPDGQDTIGVGTNKVECYYHVGEDRCLTPNDEPTIDILVTTQQITNHTLVFNASATIKLKNNNAAGATESNTTSQDPASESSLAVPNTGRNTAEFSGISANFGIIALVGLAIIIRIIYLIRRYQEL